MGKFGGFYKGEKKKQKKDKENKRSSAQYSAAGLTLPELIKRKKNKD